MKKKFTAMILSVVLAGALLAGCGNSATGSAGAGTETVEDSADKDTETVQDSADKDTETVQDSAEKDAETDTVENTAGTGTGADAVEAGTVAALEDGIYTAVFTSDSSMFHVNEAYDNKGILTVKDGQMILHVTLVSKKIVNLFPGTAEDAQKEGAVLLEPTTDKVDYKDGTTGEAYGFDIPVPAIGEEFDCALIGEKGKWYDHKVIVTDPVKTE